MGICWYCYWGWPKPVADIYLRALEKLNGDDSPLKFGPAHIVWEDENFDCALMCLVDFDKYTNGYTEEEMEIVKQSLIELSELQESEYSAEPDDYDDEHPELYPPDPRFEMVRI